MAFAPRGEVLDHGAQPDQFARRIAGVDLLEGRPVIVGEPQHAVHLGTGNDRAGQGVGLPHGHAARIHRQAQAGLGLTQMQLHVALLGDVFGRAHIAHHRRPALRLLEHRLGLAAHPAHGAARPHDPVLVGAALAHCGVEGAREARDQVVAVARVDAGFEHRIADWLLRPEPPDDAGAGRHHHPRRVQPPFPHTQM